MRRTGLLWLVLALLVLGILFVRWLLRVPPRPVLPVDTVADRLVQPVFEQHADAFAVLWVADLGRALTFLQPLVPGLDRVGALGTNLIRGLTDDLWVVLTRSSRSPRGWTWIALVPMAATGVRGLFALQFFLPDGLTLMRQAAPGDCVYGFVLQGLQWRNTPAITGAYCPPFLVVTPEAANLGRMKSGLGLRARPASGADARGQPAGLLARAWIRPRRLPAQLQRDWLKARTAALPDRITGRVFWAPGQRARVVLDWPWPGGRR